MNLQADITRAERKLCASGTACEFLDRLCHDPDSICGQVAPRVPAVAEIRHQERSRMGRELHDSTAQTIVALQLKVMRLKGMSDDPAYRCVFSEVEEAIQKLHQEIRAISLLTSLPPLKQGKLTHALADMSERFARLTGLDIAFRTSGSFALSPATEASIYRIAEEALTNVFRHARARTVTLHLQSDPAGLRLSVDDDGVGIERRNRRQGEGGVGLNNIRIRVRELQGRLSFRRLKRGSRLLVSIPNSASPALELGLIAAE